MTHTSDLPADLVPHGHRWGLIALVAVTGLIAVGTSALFVIALALVI